jgi:signal transduction histidine kinase/DNA-binding response OmpR family regulator
MGSLAYKSVNALSGKVQEAAQDRPYLDYLKLIIADLDTAENKVYTYTITQDTLKDRPACLPAIEKIELHLERFESEEQFHYLQADELDYVQNLIEAKGEILVQLVEMIDTGDFAIDYEMFRAEIERLAIENRIRNIRPILLEEIDQTEIWASEPPAEPAPDSLLETIEPDPEKEKKRFSLRFKDIKLFKNRKKDKTKKDHSEDKEAAPPIEDLPVPPTSPVALNTPPNPASQTQVNPAPNPPFQLTENLQSSVDEFEEVNLQKIAEQRVALADLSRKGEEEMRKLNDYVRELESKVLIETKALAKKAEAEAQKTSRYIAWFSGTVLVLCFILIAVIFSEFARNTRLNHKLEDEKSRAEKLAKVKEDFLANMSHEIRTPMNAVMGFAEQLAGTSLNQKQNRFLQPIRNSAHYLLALINDILDYSKLESGRFELEKTPFRPAALLAEVLQTVQPLVEKKGISLQEEGFESLPPVLQGDPLRLRQMLFNLLGNAIKFTHKGSVSLIVSVQEGEEGQVLTEFAVQDTGVGIPADQLDKIFKDFVQADSSTTRRFGGTGLGLSITRKLAELHGGRVEIDSEEGLGTTVSLHLPYALGKQAELPLEAQNAQIRPGSIAGKRFLVADDEPFNQELIQVILDKWQVKADIVGNGKVALEYLADQDYDLILLDLRMPEMDGITTARFIREELKLEVPILALTATSTQEEISQALQSGINGHLLKPFQESELLATVSHLLGVPVEVKDSKPPVQTDAPEKTETANNQFSLEHLRKLTNQNPRALQRMLDLFLKSAVGLGEAMQKAVQSQDWPDLSMKAHRLIPPCRHLGMTELVDELRQLETLAKGEARRDEIIPLYERVKGDLDELVGLVEQELANLPQ